MKALQDQFGLALGFRVWSVLMQAPRLFQRLERVQQYLIHFRGSDREHFFFVPPKQIFVLLVSVQGHNNNLVKIKFEP